MTKLKWPNKSSFYVALRRVTQIDQKFRSAWLHSRIFLWVLILLCLFLLLIVWYNVLGRLFISVKHGHPMWHCILTQVWIVSMATIFFPHHMLPWLQTQCQEVRKRKELELQILTETICLWEGEDIKTFGSVIYMSQTMVQNQGCEVRYYSHQKISVLVGMYHYIVHW